MTTRQGVAKRLSRDFLLQAIYIGLAALVGVFAVSTIVQNVLVKQALVGEADFYWETVTQRPDLPLPETKNMVSYRDGYGRPVPQELRDLEIGFHEIPDHADAVVYVSERGGERLYQVFDSVQVGWLITWFGLVPLAIALAVIYISLYQAYRVSRKAVSPIIQFAHRVEQFDPSQPDATLFAAEIPGNDANDEIHTLNSAMQELTERVLSFIERESTFTRDASHELRSPLTVIGMATDSLLRKNNLSGQQTELIRRVRSAAKDMEELTEAFLLLARESNQGLIDDWVSVNEVVELEIERARLIFAGKQVEIQSQADCHLIVKSAEKVIASVIGNLLRNGMNYTDEGVVSVSISKDRICITDSGPGMASEEITKVVKPFERGKNARNRGGFGVGLTIVSRLCDRFEWPLTINSQIGTGTAVTVEFPDSRSEELN